MAAAAKFETSTSSPDAVGYMNSQRGSSYTASLDRSGSFREGAEGRMSASSMPNQTKSLSQPETSLIQAIMPDLKSVVQDQKLPRQGDLKRTLGSVFGVSPEESASSEVTAKNLSVEELKRARSNIHEGYVRARDRAKLMTDVLSNFDKTFQNVVTKKRSRSDSFSNERSGGAMAGMNLTKIAAHGHLNASGLDQGQQRTEERAKSSIPNRRIRTSMADMRMDARPNASLKPCSPVNREREMPKHGNSGTTLLEEKAQPSAMVGGWEKSKMKKKRSGIKSDVSDMVRSRPVGGDRESKQGMQQRVGNDAQSRLSGAPSFRPNAREEGINGNTGMAKANTSARTPRTATGGPRTSPVVHRTAGSPDDSEISQSTTKLHGGSGVNSRKRSASTQSPSPPVTQWGGQRHNKMSRVARRTNFPLVSGPDDIPFQETEENSVRNNEGADLLRHPANFLGQQAKLRGDLTHSSGLSENEDTYSENKLKDRIKKCTELEERGGQTLHKVRNLPLPSRKNRVPSEGEEDVEDGIKRQGRPGRLPTPSRSGFPPVEKLDPSDSMKQSRSIKLESERAESKPGRPPSKKIQNKQISRQRPLSGNETMEITEKSDDREELLASAKLALSTRYTGANTFWKNLEPVFRLVSSEGATYLTQKVQLLNEYAVNVTAFDGDLQYSKSKGDVGYASLKSTSLSSARDDNCKEVLNIDDFGVYDKMIEMAGNHKHGASPVDHADHPAGMHNGISICQLLLSAMIEEDDEGDVDSRVYCHSSREECFSNDAHAINCATNADISTLEDSRRVDMIYSNGFMGTTSCRYYDEPRPYDAENNDVSSAEFQYNQMSVEDRIFLELNEIGLSPEPVPDLGSSEDEGIDESIGRLEEKLHSQVTSNKHKLSKLEKSVLEAKEIQRRELERMALDKLVGIAYGKYMAVCGPNVPVNKSNKVARHHVAGFVKRTLARCQAFEQTGKSCFSEPPYSEMFQSVTYGDETAACTETAVDGNGCHPNLPGMKGRIFTNGYATGNVADNTLAKEDSLSNKVKKRELLLNVGNLTSSTKGKRSERDRDGKRNKEMSAKNGASRVGRPAMANAKGERKSKTKPKHKTTQLSASLNELISNEPSPSPSINKPHDGAPDRNMKHKGGPGVAAVPNEVEPMDLSNLQIPEIDVLGVGDDFSNHPQDISSWFNFEDEALQDQDLMGLEIPMDDLSDLNMMV